MLEQWMQGFVWQRAPARRSVESIAREMLGRCCVCGIAPAYGRDGELACAQCLACDWAQVRDELGDAAAREAKRRCEAWLHRITSAPPRKPREK